MLLSVTSEMKSICVFCGAREGAMKVYAEVARDFGAEIARRGWRLVYGGAKVGLMGAVAGGVLDAGGSVKGIIPEVLDWPDARWDRVKDMEVVPDLTVRKARMMEESDAFVALPGGTGTIDEIFELAAAKQLKMTDKPLFVLNMIGYFDPIQGMLRNAVRQGFTPQEDADGVRFVRGLDGPDGLMELLSAALS